MGRRWVAAVVVGLTVVTTACADPNFKANDEDTRRLGLLRADPLATYLGAPAACTESLAHYVPSDGEPLSFAGVARTTIHCPAPGEGITGVVAAAEAAGWEPVVDVGRLAFAKQYGEVWTSAEVVVHVTTDFSVNLTAPPHGSKGFAPVPAQLAAGRTCADALTARQPPPADCEAPKPS